MGLLRLALAICVFCAHASSFGVPVLRGEIAVEIFFVISGFYMQLVLGDVYTPKRMGQGWLKKFYLNRYLRLFPIYIATVAATLAVNVLLQGGAVSPPLSALRAVFSLSDDPSNIALKAYLLLTNLTMFFQDAAMFIGVKHGLAHFVADFSDSQIPIWQALAIPQAWSIGIELTFYMMAPFLLRLASKKLLLIALASFVLKELFLVVFGSGFGWYGHLGVHPIPNVYGLWGFRFFPFELSYFLVGALSCRFYRSSEFRLGRPTLRRQLAAYLVVLLSVTVFSLVFNRPEWSRMAPLLFAAFVPMLFSLFKNSTQDRAIGELSYPFYVSHLLCVRVTSPLEHSHGPAWAAAAAFVLAMGCSVALIKGGQYFDGLRLRIRSV